MDDNSYNSPRHRIAILTISDKAFKGEREDLSAKVIKELVENSDPVVGEVVFYTVVPDEMEDISAVLMKLSDENKMDLIITTGGTGFSPRDVTPEATLNVIDRQVPGLVEAMRIKSLDYTPNAMLSRAVSGIRNRTLIINLPGSPRGVSENLQIILPALPHGLNILRGLAADCASLGESKFL